MIFTDQLQRTIKLTEAPKRIVSLVPSQTELLCDLGLETSIVGITKFCVHPRCLTSNKQIVGGTKQVHFDKIKSLYPDIILCNKEENTLEMVSVLETIAPVHISDIYTISHCQDLITMYGELFAREDAAIKINKSIKNEHKNFKKVVLERPSQNVAYFIWKNPWMVAGSNTFIDHLLAVNKFENVFQDQARYPEIKLSDLKNKNLDMILLSSEPYPFKEKDVISLKELFPNIPIKIVDGEAFSWYGSRLAKAFDYFKRLDN